MQRENSYPSKRRQFFRWRTYQKNIFFYKFINKQCKLLNEMVEEYKQVLKLTFMRIFSKHCQLQDFLEE